MKFGYLKGVRTAILPPRQQPDAVLSQANPVSTTLYTVLATTRNVRIISMSDFITWAVTQPTPLDIIVTIDGQTIIFVRDNPVSGTPYSATWQEYSAEVVQTQGPANANTPNRSFLLEGRSVKVEARVTWAVTQPTPLVYRVKWAKW